MVKVISPAFSIDCRGSIRKTFTYSKGKNCNIVKKYSKPTDNKTSSQLNVRGVYAQGCAEWDNMTELQKNIYNEKAKKQSLVGFNIFLSEYLNSHQIPSNTSILGQAIIGFMELGQ